MSYFAVLNEEPDKVRIELCHLNLWHSTSRTDRLVLFDVGIGITVADPHDIKDLAISVPFEAESADDLQTVLGDGDTASLVFGEPVTVLNGSRSLEFGQYSLDLIGCQPKLRAEYTTPNGTVWLLNPSRQLTPGKLSYFRCRFVVRKLGAAWQSERGGQLLDLRISDHRGSVSEKKWKSLESRIVDIESLNAFVIAPSALRARQNHPTFRYLRILEARSWSKYLGDHSSRFDSKMLVYYWRHSDRITVRKPFLGFLDLEELHGAQLAKERYATIPLTALLTVALFRSYETLAGVTSRAASSFTTGFAAFSEAFGALSGFEKFNLAATVIGLVEVLWAPISRLWNRRNK